MPKLWSVPVSTTTAGGKKPSISPGNGAFSPVYRNAKFAKELLVCLPNNVYTLHDILLKSMSMYGTRQGVGARPVIRHHDDHSKKVGNRPQESLAGRESGRESITQLSGAANDAANVVPELGAFLWMTFGEFGEIALSIGRALVVQNGPFKLTPQKDIVTIYSPTCPEWLAVTHGCFSQSLAISSAYAALNADGLASVVEETEARVIFAHPEVVKVLVQVLPKAKQLLTVVVLTSLITNEKSDDPTKRRCSRTAEERAISMLQFADPKLNVISLSAMILMGNCDDSRVQKTNPPAPETLACVMYTSGSSGKPRGVCVSHGNAVAGMAGNSAACDKALSLKEDVYLAYLPQSHVLEFSLENLAMFHGLKIGFGSPKTLTDSSVINCKGDLRELRPTFIAGVPILWDMIVRGIEAKLSEKPSIMRAIFNSAVKLRLKAYNAGVPFIGNILQSTVLHKVGELTGGRLKFVFSGGAPISERTLFFVSGAICPIFTGYGMTEAMGGIMMCGYGMPICSAHVGPPVGSVEVCLRDVPDATYLAKNNTGEVLLRGRGIVSSYFKNPLETQNIFVPATDGGAPWFCTGDIVRRLPNGFFQVIDRQKNLIKLASGEFIELERLESVYATQPICNRVCFVVKPGGAFAIAIVQPNAEILLKIAAKIGIDLHVPVSEKNRNDNQGLSPVTREISWKELCVGHDDLNKQVLRIFQRAAQQMNYANANIPRSIILSGHEWTPESGLLTPAMKLKRRAIADLHSAEIDAIYAAHAQATGVGVGLTNDNQPDRQEKSVTLGS